MKLQHRGEIKSIFVECSGDQQGKFLLRMQGKSSLMEFSGLIRQRMVKEKQATSKKLLGQVEGREGSVF